MAVRLAVVALVVVALTGCFDAGNSAGADDSSTSARGRDRAFSDAASRDVPSGCDTSRPAIVHGPDGVLAASASGLVGFACFVTSPWIGYEPSLGLTSDGTLFLYPAWEDQPISGGVVNRFNGMGTARLAPGSDAWERKTSTIGPVNWHFWTADPFMHVDAATDRVFIEDLAIPPFNCSSFSFSDDKGETWTQTLGGCMEWDHVSIASGPPTVSSPDGYPNVVYRCAINLVALSVASMATTCQKSLDGGMLWEPPGEPAYLWGADGPGPSAPCHGAAHHLFVDHRGWLWLPRAWCDDPYVALSKDEGATWQQFRVDDQPSNDHDVGVAVDTAGNVYAFWMRAPEALPVIAVSKDDGATWSEPISVAPPGLITAGQPSISAGGVGKVGFTYAANFESDDGQGVFAVVAAGYGVDGDSPVFHTAIASPPDDPLAQGSCQGSCAGQEDFLTATIGPDGSPWGAFINGGLVSAGRLWAAPSLWDDADPNGRYA